jgi:hypothetical protein
MRSGKLFGARGTNPRPLNINFEITEADYQTFSKALAGGKCRYVTGILTEQGKKITAVGQTARGALLSLKTAIDKMLEKEPEDTPRYLGLEKAMDQVNAALLLTPPELPAEPQESPYRGTAHLDVKLDPATKAPVLDLFMKGHPLDLAPEWLQPQVKAGNVVGLIARFSNGLPPGFKYENGVLESGGLLTGKEAEHSDCLEIEVRDFLSFVSTLVENCHLIKSVRGQNDTFAWTAERTHDQGPEFTVQCLRRDGIGAKAMVFPDMGTAEAQVVELYRKVANAPQR